MLVIKQRVMVRSSTGQMPLLMPTSRTTMIFTFLLPHVLKQKEHHALAVRCQCPKASNVVRCW